MLGRIFANIERNLLVDLDCLMDGLNTLSSGLLSDTMIAEGIL